jgi:hypothetical protein
VDFKLFEREQNELRAFIDENKRVLSDEVAFILDTFLELISHFPEAVREFDLESLHEYLSEKALEFYELLKKDDEREIDAESVLVKKDEIYLFEFSSISLIKGSLTFLYPHMLLEAANYSNFVTLLCRKLQKTETSSITLVGFLDLFYEFSVRCRPKLLKWDIDLIREISRIDFSGKNFAKATLKFESKKRLVRLRHLRVVGVYHYVNFLSLGFTPFIHLAHHQVEIPEELKPFIEIENHPARRQRGFQVFRLFLFPLGLEHELSSRLKESGMTGKLSEYYLQYNWDSLIQTKTGKWRWDLKFSDLKTRASPDSCKYDHLFFTGKRESITPGFVTYLDTVHRLESIKSEDLVIKTGFNKRTLLKFNKKAIEEKFVLSFLRISRIGLGAYYQVCFENTDINQQLARFLESLPKVRVAKSKDFFRYILFLPLVAVKRLNHRLNTGEKQGEFEIISKESSFGPKSIQSGVNLKQVWQTTKKMG